MSLNPDPAQMDEGGFVAAYGGIYEHSPWIAKAVWQTLGGKVPRSAIKLSLLMAGVLEGAGMDAKLALLRAHPDLAGKAAIAGDLTQSSRSEQAGAGLDACTAEDFARFERQNAAYKEKFGFPFIVAVKGLTRHDILDQFEVRLQNRRDKELQTALAEVNKIARLRLTAMEDET
ncbi:MAG: OHCU decarboxylase [Robiginitomaculum sp.]|nr:MAG: OHCU decarboxylase [Robiginitomaculum sp.]